MGLVDFDECIDEEGELSFVTVWGEATLDELQDLIDHYRKLGFNRVCHGQENSTLCIQKVKEKTC